MKIKHNFYKTFSLLAKELMNQRQMSIYSSKYSRRDFTRHQLLTLLLIKTYSGKGYEKFTEFLEVTQIPKWLNINKIPHFTTLQKFASRQMITELEKFLFESAKLSKSECKHMAIDATGMSLHNASKHYEMRIGQLIRKRDFMKCAIMADLDNQLIYAIKMRIKSRSDHRDFIPLWNKIKHLPFFWFFMDKGYDSDTNHGLIFASGKKSFGCVRAKTKQRHRMKGKMRRKAYDISWQCKKNWRALIETINSVFKRMFGKVIFAKNLHTMKVEMYLKLITYNFYRLISRNLVKVSLLLLRFIAYFQKFFWTQSRFLRLLV